MTEAAGVTAIVTFPESRHDEGLSLFQRHLPMLRAYDGCRRFVVSHDIRARGVFTIHEEWVSEAHLDVHLKDKAITAIFAEIDALGGQITNIFTKEVHAS
ncbi:MULTISPECIES: putative quinol monooxygenase [unclassified Saccharibacter]|uniref:putative quinol monooxygenase n=1 Tax=unclassified Saccharibacter TaxID=2648722 RepID=UPI001323CD0D|nr:MULTISPECIES: antibiotic biosynthesis monooxygenase [unclassified Saccharibacter]MXV37030.1 hypothetical protein [Saccharibacter sp. EH611]